MVIKKISPKTAIVAATSAIFTAAPKEKFDRIIYLYPEKSLTYPDYRSEERVYYLLHRLRLQYSSAKTGFFIVTRHPRRVEDTLLLSPDEFYQAQITTRLKLRYPPITDLIKLTVQGKHFKTAHQRALLLKEQIEKKISASPGVAASPRTGAKRLVRGPFQNFGVPSKNLHEWHLLLSGPLPDLVPLYQNLPLDRADLSPHKII